MVRPASILFALACAGCIATRSEDPHGTARFSASVNANPADYAAPATLPGVGGSVAVVPSAAAGAGSVVSQLPPPLAPGSGVAGSPVVATAGAPGRTVPPAAVGGSAAVAGRAAVPAAAGSMAAAMAGSGAAPGSEHAGMLTLDFKSVNQGGTYAPQNVGAVWIETSSGMFVKTLERWGNIRASHLTRWAMASGGWGGLFGGGNTADQMDAVSKATMRSHGAHHETWDMQDPSGKVVADGKYRVVIEVTEDNFRAGASAEVPFEKGPMPQTISAPDKAPYAALMLTYQP
jgi:hypothetical protein